jgi:hypothetical protein
MKGIASTGAPKIHVPGWMGGWMDGWMGVKAVLRIAYSNQKLIKCKASNVHLGNTVQRANFSQGPTSLQTHNFLTPN